MTVELDAQKLIDEGVALLKETTVGYANRSVRWQQTQSTKWWQALDRLGRARALLDPVAPPPPPPPPPPAGGWWESVLTPRPAFAPRQTIRVTTAAGLRVAVASLRPGDYVVADAPIVCSTLTIKARLTAPARIDLTGVTIAGGDNGGVNVEQSDNIELVGGKITSTRKGLRIEDSSRIVWHGFEVLDCGDTGVFVTAIDGDNVGIDLQGTIRNCGLRWASTSPLIDPHDEKGTGVHGAYIGASFTRTDTWTRGSRFVFDVADQGTGAAVQVGGQIAGCFVAVRANRITWKATRQVAGNAVQLWGKTHDLEVQVEATDCAGRAVDCNGLYNSGAGPNPIRVTHGRATRCVTNPKLTGSAFEPHPRVAYTDCQETR